jgi:hypothetical protein
MSGALAKRDWPWRPCGTTMKPEVERPAEISL